MIHIGNQTACFTTTPREPFDYALTHGFDAFEWFPDKKPGAGWDEDDLDAEARRTIRDTARARGIRLSVHARWQANLIEPDSYPLVWRDFELAQDLGAALLNVHLYHEHGLAAFVEAIVPLIRRTAAAGLQLAIENTPQHSPEHINELFARVRSLGSAKTSHVGMCLDPGHANLCATTRNDFLGFCDRLDPQVPIIHLHLHENWGDADTHLPLFTGPAARDDSGIRGLLARLRRRNFSGAMILEQWPHPPSLLDNARDRLLRLWSAAPGKLVAGTEPVITVPGKTAESSAPLAGLAAELVDGDRRFRSWREKLDFVRSLLARTDPSPTADQLIDVAIYLRFLGTGEIVCSEDGRHFRPAHHARISSKIQERLAALTTPDNAFIVRKIYAWLPSSSPAFQRPEPLTRIRDIAHRNDIGPELKREIKTTLQNKLHRCAGPEDVVTASALLARITAPGAEYPAEFVEQFKLFYEELLEFFNAQSLDERLTALIPSVDPTQAGLIRLFGQQKAGDNLPDKMAALETLTSLRQNLLDTFKRKTAAENQDLLLADVGLEDFAFVLLSEIINACEATDAGAAPEHQTKALLLALRNVVLSGIEPHETSAVEAELRAWGKALRPDDREGLVRVKATLLRCRRLTEDFTAQTVALLSERVEKLGHALGVADHAIRTFAESDIRAHNVFQVSKLVANLLRWIRERLGLPGWDVLVGGQAVGRVKAVSLLDGLERHGFKPAGTRSGTSQISFASEGAGDRVPAVARSSSEEGPLIVLAERAVGDEEIPANVAAIVLAHEMPHLSHLGVRARQAGVVFVTCEEAPEFERLKSFEGRMISFTAGPDKVVWENSAGASASAKGALRLSPTVPSVSLRPEARWIPLEQTVAETGGGKAAGARLLAELSLKDGAEFSTPSALVVPFGVMELALDEAPTLAAQYRRLMTELNGMNPADLSTATQRLRELVQKLTVPDAIVSEAVRKFGQDSHLIVRSSANCEDLPELAGAGLYESVMNVAPSNLVPAIRTVWSSLWTRRAVLSRERAGIPHKEAHMAVLVQELLDPDLSLVLHTVNPITHCASEVYAEIVVGLGDTLASAATRGSPYRMVCDKHSGAETMLSFANFSEASRPNPAGGVRRETVDYSKVDLSRDVGARKRLGERLARIGHSVEQALQRPQDIEGAVVKDRIYLVQTRSQPGLPPRKDL